MLCYCNLLSCKVLDYITHAEEDVVNEERQQVLRYVSIASSTATYVVLLYVGSSGVVACWSAEEI